MRVAATVTALACALACTLTGVQLATSGPARADESTVSQNWLRDGWDSSEPQLSPAAVSGKSFGQIFGTQVNGQVYGQPLNVGNSVLVATEDDYVYSINRDTGAVNWSTQLGSPYASAAENCKDTSVVQPYIGVTSAPVYDPGTGTIYVSAMLSGPPGDDKDLSTATPADDLFALNEQTGAIDWQKQIMGSPTDDKNITFNAANQLQRTGLLLVNGWVYMGFGSLCEDGAADHGYDGFIAGVNTTTQAQTLWSDQAATPAYGGGIWQGGGGLVSDGTSIYFSTGNGTVPPAGPGSSAPSAGDFGNAVVKVTPQSDGTLQATDFFSPGDADQLNAADHDLGSGGPAILPFTTKDYPNGLVVMAGKDARVFLLSEASLGGRSSSETGSTAVFTGSPGLVDDPATNGGVSHGLWGHMAAFAGVSPTGQPVDYIYYEGTGWGSTDNMYVLNFDAANPAAPVLENIGATSQLFGFSSGSPVITSSGSAATSAVVWEVHANDSTGAGGALDAYTALPSNGVLQEIWSSPIGDASQFTVPATSDGRVYVGARNDGTPPTTGTNATACPTDFESPAYTSTDSPCVGEVYGFGIRSAQLAGSAVSLGHVALGQTAAKTVTLTNTGDTPVTITKVTTPPVPFGTPAYPALNQPIAPGASVSFPVTFTPQAKGTTTGKYVLTTTDGFTAARTTTITVGGVGDAPAGGAAVVPSPGGGWTLNGSAVMKGSTLQLTPATASHVGSAVFYQPIASSGLRATFTARLNGGAGGDGMTFSLLSPASRTTTLGAGAGELGFGGLSGVCVVLGTRKDAGDPSANFVGIATGASHGHLVFAATSTKVPNLRSGTHVIIVTVSGRKVTVALNGHVYVSASVPVASTVLPAFTAANGGRGDIHAVSGVAITSPGTGGRLPAPGGGWSFNGSAAMTGATAALTTAAANEAGSVVFPEAVGTASFGATFNVALGGGTGGEGMTFALLSPGTKATSVGANGQGLGFAGLNGLAVVLGTQQISGAPSADFAGIETGTAGRAPSFVATKDLTGAINLRAGTHTVTVSLNAGTLTVTIDGSTVLTQAVTVPSAAYVAFTGSTGSLTDRHLVQDAAISAG